MAQHVRKRCQLGWEIITTQDEPGDPQRTSLKWRDVVNIYWRMLSASISTTCKVSFWERVTSSPKDNISSWCFQPI